MKDRIAQRAAGLIRKGWTVNLGIGLPLLVNEHLDHDAVHVLTENGLLGAGPPPGAGELDQDLIDAGRNPVTERPGASFFDSAVSFGLLRGGRVSAAVMGALQVDARGLVANWAVPGSKVLGVGGAMDILAGAARVIVTMRHTDPDGSPKIVERCTLPITSLRPADWIVTELATFRYEGGLTLVDIAPESSLSEVRARTAAAFAVAAADPARQDSSETPGPREPGGR